MKLIFIDIETLPVVEENRDFIESKLQKILARKGEDFSETVFQRRAEIAFQNTALHGSLGRLLCIGLTTDSNGKAEKPCICGQDKNTGEFHLDEAKTLMQFWNHLDRIEFDANRDLIIGHNILGFDLPFLYHRSMICGVRPSRQILNGKPWEIAESVYDTMDRWQMGKYYEKVSLEELALAFGLNCPKKGSVNGENLLESLQNGKHREIREYCLKDVLCVRQLYYKMTFQAMPEFSTEKPSELALGA